MATNESTDIMTGAFDPETSIIMGDALTEDEKKQLREHYKVKYPNFDDEVLDYLSGFTNKENLTNTAVQKITNIERTTPEIKNQGGIVRWAQNQWLKLKQSFGSGFDPFTNPVKEMKKVKK